MARIITCNTNGIRAAARKGFFDWLEQEQADVVCIQETKAQEHQLSDPVFFPDGYHRYFHDAQKKGYSGVAIYSNPFVIVCIFSVCFYFCHLFKAFLNLTELHRSCCTF